MPPWQPSFPQSRRPLQTLLVVGLATAFVQAVFQIEDTAFSLLPKTIAMIAIALFGGFSMLRGFEALATLWIGNADTIVRQSWS